MLLFSLSPISEDSENLNQLGSFPIVLTPSTLSFGDDFSYRFCDEISQLCESFRSILETGTLVLDYDSFCRLVSKSDIILDTLASDLDITPQLALEEAQRFFSDKNVIVQATLYKVGSYLQLGFLNS